MPSLIRCSWCAGHPALIHYHDTEWGRKAISDFVFFEFLILEGAQAGLSWLTILLRREGYRQALLGFDYNLLAVLSDSDLASLLENKLLVRNRSKIRSVRSNALMYQELLLEFSSFYAYVYSFMPGKITKVNLWTNTHIPSQTPESLAISNDLVRRGFKFVGPTIIYAFMQATGIVVDHTADCFLSSQSR